jgi:hypothetical protein
MDVLTRKFITAVSHWHWEKLESDDAMQEGGEFRDLFYTSRTDKYNDKRYRNLVGPNTRTTVMDLTGDEIVRIHEYLGWPYSQLIGEYGLGRNTLTITQAEQLTLPEGNQIAFDESIAA